MLFTKLQNLADHIIRHLAYQPNSNLEELKAAIDFFYGKTSKQGWYKAIRQLMDCGVIIKTQKLYSLNAAWTDHVIELAFFMRSNYQQSSSGHSIVLPMKYGKKIIYKFPDLITMDTFWGHIMASLVIQMPNTSFYAYNPHTWFFVAHKYESETYFETMKHYRAGNYTVVGARTDIDLWAEQFHPEKITHYYCSPKPVFKDPRLYLTSFGDYFISVKIQQTTAQEINELCRQTKIAGKNWEPTKEMMKFFHQKSPCSLTIVKDTKKTSVFARKIRRYF